MPVATDLISILPLALNVHIAGVPVAILGHTLRTPMRPDAEFGVPIPFRRIIGQQRIPSGLIWSLARQIRNIGRRLKRHAIPSTRSNTAAVRSKTFMLDRLPIGDAETGGRTAVNRSNGVLCSCDLRGEGKRSSARAGGHQFEKLTSLHSFLLSILTVFLFCFSWLEFHVVALPGQNALHPPSEGLILPANVFRQSRRRDQSPEFYTCACRQSVPA